MATAHDLPDLPPLPPLTLPTQHMDYPSLNETLAGDIPHFKSPAISFAESFTTAYTSQFGEEYEEFSRLDMSSISLSQDVQNSAGENSIPLSHQGDSGQDSTINSTPASATAIGAPSVSQAAPKEPTWSSRHRGESFSSLMTTHDLDRDEDEPISPAPVERFRHQSLQSQEAPIPFVRGGDLPLPSRAPIGSQSNSPPVHNEQIVSSSSLQSIATQHNSYNTAGRVRSGSLGFGTPNFSRRTVGNAYPPVSARSSIGNDAFVIAVIGTPGCGKSTVIRKGLSGHGLVESSIPAENAGSRTSLYIRRTGRIDLEKSPSGKTSHILEVIEIEALTTDGGLLKWPQGLPPIDGVIICYDASDESSYRPVEGLLKMYRTMILPVIVLGCKTDRTPAIEPGDAQAMLKTHDTGLIEVSAVNPLGKEKMKKSFQYLLKAVCRQRGPDRIIDHRNPASEQLLALGTPDGDSWTHTPTLTSSRPTFITDLSTTTSHPPSEPSEFTPVTVDSGFPVERAAITSDPTWSPLSPLSTVVMPPFAPKTSSSSATQDTSLNGDDSGTLFEEHLPFAIPHSALDEQLTKPKAPLPRPSQWADLDALLDKLLFLAVSGDDPSYAKHFLLTHRRFATPRSVLLAMQKRMRLLDTPTGDPMFAVFAQMRICNLLETWIREFPYDFAVKGTAGALNALIKSICSKTHLLHYGSEFLPFLEQLPSLVDQDATWALKSEVTDADSEVYSPEDEDEEAHRTEDKEESDTSSELQAAALSSSRPAASSATPPSRERKSSLPLSRALLSPPAAPTEQNPKQHLKDLVKLAHEVLTINSEEIAQEITRQGVRKFLMIKARDWLQYTFVSGKSQTIIDFNIFSSHLADWVVSLILCHERPRYRARQIEKFAEIAHYLRRLNNYSGLRAFVAGINNATDDATMEHLKTKFPDHAKNLKSWDLLLQHIRSHRSYRLALRNSKGSCIPALEVHLSDLIRAHEGNNDRNEDYPTKIAWGKYNLMGRFIMNTIQCQTQCRNSHNYDFPDRSHIMELFYKRPTMSTETQQSRLKASDNDYDDPHGMPSNPDGLTGLRKIFFW